jgi:hypothetical protein
MPNPLQVPPAGRSKRPHRRSDPGLEPHADRWPLRWASPCCARSGRADTADRGPTTRGAAGRRDDADALGSAHGSKPAVASRPWPRRTADLTHAGAEFDPMKRFIGQRLRPGPAASTWIRSGSPSVRGWSRKEKRRGRPWRTLRFLDHVHRTRAARDQATLDMTKRGEIHVSARSPGPHHRGERRRGRRCRQHPDGCHMRFADAQQPQRGSLPLASERTGESLRSGIGATPQVHPKAYARPSSGGRSVW